METYFNREEAVKAMHEKNAFSLLFNIAETNKGQSFFLIQSPDTVMDLLKRSIEKGVTNHFHEAVFDISKIYFDIDIKIPESVIQNSAIKQFCLTSLGDNGVNYTSGHIGYFQSPFEQYLVYIIQDAIVQKYSQVFCPEFAIRNFVFDKPLLEQTEVSRQQYLKDIDYLFDTYRNSRDVGNKTFKISWHLVFCANEFCMLRTVQKQLAIEINNILDTQLSPIIEKIQQELPETAQYLSNLRNCLDIGVYTGSNIRLIGQCRESENQATSERKSAIHLGGEFIRSQRHLITTQQYKLSKQLPNRCLISCIIRTDGTELEFITRDIVENNQQNGNDQKQILNLNDLPFSEFQLKHILSKININNIEINEIVKRQNKIFVNIRDNISPCPVCILHKGVNETPNHENERMYLVIDIKMQTVRFSCYRIEQYLARNKTKMTSADYEVFSRINKAIYLDYEGERFISEYDIGKGFYRYDETDELNQNDITYVRNDDTKSITRLLNKKTHEQMNTRYNKQHQISPEFNNIMECKQITASEITEYPHNYRRLYIHSHMGTGKTKQLFQYMSQYIKTNPKDRIYIITFRITFAQDMISKINAFMTEQKINAQFACYKDIKEQLINTQYLIVQVESLNRIKMQGCKCGLLILDESESIYEQLTSGLSEKQIANLVNFKTLIRTSNRVIAMDAYMQERTLELTERFAQNAKPEQEVKDLNINKDVLMISNNWQRDKRYVVYKGKNKKDLWLNDIINCIEAGEKVVIPCCSALIAKAVHQCICDRFNNTINIQIFTQDTNEKQRLQDLKDVQNSWMKYDVLIFSPTISAGISFERQHYSRMFAYYDIGVTTLETFFQMMGRIRQLDKNCIHILIAGIPQDVPHTVEAIEKDYIIKRNNAQVPPILERIQFEYDDNLNIKLIKTDDYRVTMHNVRCRNMSIQKPFSRFYWMVGLKSEIFIRKSFPTNNYKYHLDIVAKQIKSLEFNSLRDVPFINDDEYLKIIKKNAEELSREEQLQIKKKQYTLDIGIDQDSVHFFDSMKNERQYRIWKLKYQYMQQRLICGSLRKAKQENMIANQIQNGQDSAEQNSLWQKIETLELLLKVLGLNQDIINPERFPSKCQHTDCKCIKQPIEVLQLFAQQFLSDRQKINVITNQIKASDIKIDKFTFDSESTVSDLIKKFNSVLKSAFGLQLHTTNRYCILNHTDEFTKYLQQDQSIKNYNFSNNKVLFDIDNKEYTPTEKLYLCDYNYFSLDADQQISSIRSDLSLARF